MNFTDFKSKISKVTNMELPGEEIHYKMVPFKRIEALKKVVLQNNKPRKAGVLVLFYPNKNNETTFVLILRKAYKGVHSAQISFPGGKLEEADASLEYTALRETEEEVGVLSSSVKVIKKLTHVYIPPSNFHVQPFLGLVDTTPKFIPQLNEVESIIEVPLKHFLSNDVLIKETVSASYASKIEVPAFLLNNHIVWGATAMMLNEVRHIIQDVL